MQTILAELGLIVLVLLGLAYAAGFFSSSTSAVSKAEFFVSVKPIYTSKGTYLEIIVKNVGGTAATIQNITIDDTIIVASNTSSSTSGTTTVTPALDWSGKTLQPGGELRATVKMPDGFTSGQHILKIVYTESGLTKEASYQFTA